MNTLAPVAIFTYNRPLHIQQTIEALLKNELASQSDLIIYADGPTTDVSNIKSVEKTREYLKTISGFKSVAIIEQEKNIGLAGNVIDGVTQILDKYGKIIVLEDDLLTSPYFLKFMNEALDEYEQEEKVVSVHGFVYNIQEPLPENFFLRHISSLGWGTWKDSWKLFEPDGQKLADEMESRDLVSLFNFNNSWKFYKMLQQQIRGENNSWAVRWYASTFLADKLSFYPNQSLVFHNGSDSSGSNTGDEKWLDVTLAEHPIRIVEHLPLEESLQARAAYERFFRNIKIPLKVHIKKKILKIYSKFKKQFCGH